MVCNDTSCVIVSEAPAFSLTVLSNPAKRQEYDKKGILYVQDQNVVVSIRQRFFWLSCRTMVLTHCVLFCQQFQDYLNRHKGLILTCNGLGIRYSVW
jgi:hypothetical protein